MVAIAVPHSNMHTDDNCYRIFGYRFPTMIDCSARACALSRQLRFDKIRTLAQSLNRLPCLGTHPILDEELRNLAGAEAPQSENQIIIIRKIVLNYEIYRLKIYRLILSGLGGNAAAGSPIPSAIQG
jgi:hypothetical protein